VLNDAFNNGNNLKQERVNYQGVDAWKFSYEIKDGTLEFLYAPNLTPIF